MRLKRTVFYWSPELEPGVPDWHCGRVPLGGQRAVRGAPSPWKRNGVTMKPTMLALAPSDPMPPDNAQCFARVLLSEDGMTFHEIAKFAVPANDLHSVSHVLPRPIGLQAIDGMTVFRIQVGAVGPEPLASCDTEVKLYTRAD